MQNPTYNLYPEIDISFKNTLRVDDLHEVYYEVCGNRSGVPVVFLHGGPGSGCNPVQRRFFDPSYYMIVLIDQRGCGRSKPQGSVINNTTADLVADIDAIRFDPGDGHLIELPVKLKVHDSVFVPLAKWAMLIAGNYRCVQKDEMRPIKDAVHSDLEASRAVYNWVVKLCTLIGASEKDMVPFEKYANAALSLGSPSSAARALAAGAPNIERVDRLVKTVAAQKNMHLDVVDQTVALVDGWLEKNRKKA